MGRRGPGFVEIDLAGREGGNPSGEFCFTLTVMDIATGWTVNRSVQKKVEKWMFQALQQGYTVEQHEQQDPAIRPTPTAERDLNQD